MNRNRVKKIFIRNFRSIGPEGIWIDLNHIVVLVGQNNSGKSSILRALKVITEGEGSSKLTIEDFHQNKLDNCPEVILETYVFDPALPGTEWIITEPTGEQFVRERWLWALPDVSPVRVGWNQSKNGWASADTKEEKYPWGPDNIAMARRPEPHEVNPFDDPEKQANEIVKILNALVKSKISALISDDQLKQERKYQQIVDELKVLRKSVVDDAKVEIEEIETKLNDLVSSVFAGNKIEFDPQPEEKVEDAVQAALINMNAQLKMGPEGGYKGTIEKQGSGARRTLLWIALKLTVELGGGKKKSRGKKAETSVVEDRPHVLLLNEPEICLHPSAVRDARDTLYKLPETGNWQVMVTSHSPIFIDISKDNTTIVRVEKDITGKVSSETVFRPDSAQLTDEEKLQLKLLNIFDPYFAEFFFAKHIIVVEGDTEYSAFRYLLQEKGNSSVHILRARGKAPIATIIKILNHFKSSYAVLHDSDTPKLDSGKKNPAWTVNQSILDVFSSRESGTKARLVASVPDFERACFGRQVENDKPYETITELSNSPTMKARTEQLLDALIQFDKPLPVGFIEWGNLSDLEKQATK
ncbi:AAA family ATPase [Candidatus Woesebacteria bacterium]|nr:AAA family ATPase [Candidatus Woesebacteria bacterium]